MNSQEIFNSLLKNFIKPYFKKIGFKTSGQTFYLENEGFIKIIQIQKSQFNSAENVRFTFNIGVFDTYVNEKLNISIKKPKPSDCVIEKRIGFLCPENKDTWFSIDNSTDQELFSSNLKNIFNQYLLSYLDSFQSIEDLAKCYQEKADLNINSKGGGFYFAIHLLKQNKPEAISIIKTYLTKWGHSEHWKYKIECLLKNA
jgi:hypothetical protein